DWIEVVRSYQVIIWRANLDPPFCEEAKEKTYLMERFLGRRVVPNWDTFWHYDNKRAQAYLFGLQGIPSPSTFVSYSHAEADAHLSAARFPLVSKMSGGAGSEYVRLLPSPASAQREVRRAFREPIWLKALRRLGLQLRAPPHSTS